MPDEPQISFSQALEVFQGQISESKRVSCCSQYRTSLKFFLWAMPDEPQIRFSQALEFFQGQISVKVNWCHVVKNIIHVSIFFMGYA